MFVDTKSAQLCGCDEGANHLCERHLKERAEAAAEFIKVDPPCVNVLKWNPVIKDSDERPGLTALKAAGKHAASKVGIGGAPTRATTLPTEASERKKYPMATGLLFYFPDALAAVANISWHGGQQHHPDKPLHWDRNKSTDEADTAMRHLAQSGTLDTDGKRHTAKAAWRILALLQKEIEGEQQ